MKFIAAVVLGGLAEFFGHMGLPGRTSMGIIPCLVLLALAAVGALLLPKRNPGRVVKATIAVILLAFICFGLFLPSGVTNAGLSTTTGMTPERYPGVTAGELTVKFGGGVISIEKADDAGIYRAQLRGEAGAVPSHGAADNLAQIWLKQEHGLWWANRRQENDWGIQLSPQIPWKIRIRLAHSAASFDLRGISVETLGITAINTDVDLIIDVIEALNITAFGSAVTLYVPYGWSDDDIPLRWTGFFSSLEVVHGMPRGN